jgi:glutamate dehydrogenase
MSSSRQKIAAKKGSSNKKRNLEAKLVEAFQESALPGENIGFDTKACKKAVRFVLKCGEKRKNPKPDLLLESVSGNGKPRHLRLAIVNDDMPFLVDSVCATIAGFGLNIERLIHPVVGVKRDQSGLLENILKETTSGEKLESVIYIELEYSDAKTRRALEKALRSNLDDVAAAVSDWLKLQIALGDDADRLPESEGTALLRWFLDRNFTLLGHEKINLKGERTSKLGVAGKRTKPSLSKGSLTRAYNWFQEGGHAPLVVKSNQVSTVHRHVLMDLILVPIRKQDKLVGVSITSGMWTSAALAAPPDKVPLLRTQMAQLFDKFEFAAAGHAGKALEHALTSLPHDLLITFQQEELEKLSLISKSLLDRPRPKLHSVITACAAPLRVCVATAGAAINRASETYRKNVGRSHWRKNIELVQHAG